MKKHYIKKAFIYILIFVAISVVISAVLSIPYFVTPTIARFELLSQAMPTGEDVSLLDFIYNKEFPFVFHLKNGRYPKVEADTWLFDLKEDGKLYILRGVQRPDNDLSKPFFMIFINHVEVKKLDDAMVDEIMEAIKTQAEYKGNGTAFSFDGINYDTYTWFEGKTKKYEKIPDAALYENDNPAAKVQYLFLVKIRDLP